jgi:cyclohexanone monooxygenase
MQTTDRASESGSGPTRTDFDAVVVGAGFAGLYSLHRLRELGLSVRVLERADDVGGTWYHNRYPGCRCDTESHVYCFSFSEELLNEWEYSERYPRQEEILEYFRFVADRLDLRKDIQFETEVESARFAREGGVWDIRTGDGAELSAEYLVLAVGPLSEPFTPEFDGIESFGGELYHTAKWPHDPVDFAGRSVGLVGTGSSGVQAIPKVAEDAGHLTVYQRTPNYVVPAQNHPLTDEDWAEIRRNYDEIWERARNTPSGHPYDHTHRSVRGLSDEEIRESLEEGWEQGGFRFFFTFYDLLVNPETNDRVSEFIASKIRDRLDDPELAEKLVPDPDDHPYGAKRPPLNYDDYYRTFEREDVELVDVSEAPIERLTPSGIETTASRYEHDVVVFATGFDAITGGFTNLELVGRDGTTLDERWADGPQSYLGFAVDGFPNMFMVSGPQSPSAITNQPVSIEQQVDWITGCIEHLETNGVEFIEATEESVTRWVEHSNEVAEATLYHDAETWYSGDNVPGKPRTFLPYAGGHPDFREQCEEVAEEGYEGFELSESVAGLGAEAAER